MDLLVQVNNQSNGRDKLARLIQYTSRLVWHQLETRNADKYSVDRIKNLETQFSTFRKILRLGRCVDTCYTALDTLHLDDPVLRLTLTSSKLAYALFLYSDHIVWLSRSGFLKTNSGSWNLTANKFRLLSTIANLLRDLYELYHILQLNQSLLLKPSQMCRGSVESSNFSDNMQHIYTLVSAHKDVFIDTFKNSCDLFIPLTILGFTKLSPSTVGILGALSSLAALVTVYKPFTKLVPS